MFARITRVHYTKHATMRQLTASFLQCSANVTLFTNTNFLLTLP